MKSSRSVGHEGFPAVSAEPWDLLEHVVLVDAAGVPTGESPTELDGFVAFADSSVRKIDDLLAQTQQINEWDEHLGTLEVVFPRLKPSDPLTWGLYQLGIGSLYRGVQRAKFTGDPAKTRTYLIERGLTPIGDVNG